MDDNVFEAVQVTMWVSLFIFALTFALIQYNRIEAVSDLFVEANMFNNREDFVGVYLDESEKQRNARRSEIIYSILNIPDMVNETGNEEYVVEITVGGNTRKFKYFDKKVDDEVVSQGVEIDSGGTKTKYYLRGEVPLAVTPMVEKDLISHLIGPVITGSPYLPNASDTYVVSYNENGMHYIKNEE